MAHDSRESSYLIGRWAETIAMQYLLKKGLRLLDKNFRSAFGEIDLIMQDKNIICFIEVRYRGNNCLHTASESISKNKYKRIILTSHQYLLEHRNPSMDYRFDLIALSGERNDPSIEWIRNVFQA